MARAFYSERQQNEFVQLAEEQGITPAMRRLGYPASWAAGKAWCESRGVSVTVDTLRSHASTIGQWYDTSDKLLVAQEAYRVIYETLTNTPTISPREQKELADAGKKWIETMNLIEGKATNIARTEEPDNVFDSLLAEFQATPVPSPEIIANK
jgi:hypothetical protein